MRYAFIDPNGEVRQLISGDLDPSQIALFERDYAKLFGTTSVVTIADNETQVWIGGTYTPEAGFTPPPSSEPEIIEGTFEEIIEDIVEEPTNDDAPII